MKKTLIIMLLFTTFAPQLLAQTTVKLFSGGPIISAEYNLYHRYERPKNHAISITSGGNRSVGQLANVLPTGRLGGLFTFEVERLVGPVGQKLSYRSYFHLLLEGGVCYMPFSYDVEEYKGRGALSFPIMASVLIPFDQAALTVGLGVQFSRIELHKKRAPYDGMANPFFTTYVVELGFVPHNIDMGYGFFGGVSLFIRGGLNEQLATTLDVGVRAMIGVGG